MVVPDQGTGIEYYNVYKSKAEIEAEKTQKKEKEYSIYAYMLGSHAVEEAIDKGFKKRLDIHEVSLFPGESKTFGFTYLFANGNARITSYNVCYTKLLRWTVKILISSQKNFDIT